MDTLRAVTFDCWGTLIYEGQAAQSPTDREDLFVQLLRGHGVDVDSDETARDAFRQAAARHWASWRDGVSTGAVEIARWSLENLEIDNTELESRLVRRLQERALEREVCVLDGARDTLARLAGRGIRRGLICDTGFTPGRVVRQLLDRAELLDLLEVAVFSDEAGVPKPDPRVFQHALEQLGVEPHEAAHVGDLRRTDVHGARAMGMQSVRIRWAHDDTTDLPEADAVVDSHTHLCDLLGLGT